MAIHSGPYHPWVTDSPTPTWYYGTQAKHLANTWQTWTLADPHASPQVRKATLEGWFIDVLPDLNQDDPEVARYVAADTPLDCAGGFKAESLGIALFDRIESADPTGLTGLPLIWLCGALRRAGIPVP